MTGPTMRRAVAGDRPELVAVWRRAVEATHAFLTPADVDALEPRVCDEVLPALDVTVAVLGQGIAGWIGVHGLRVEALFVDPRVHRGGVGAALLAAATDGLPVVDLDVNEQNSAALAFYAAQGFVRVGRSERDGEDRPFPIVHMRRR